MVAPALRIEVLWDADSVLWAMNVLHVRPASVGVPDQSTADAVAAVCSAAFQDLDPIGGNSLRAQIVGQNRLHSVNVQDLRTINSPVWSSSILLTGTGGTTQIPDNVSLPVEFVVGPGARNGRVFQWGYSIATNAATGRPSTAAIDSTIHFWREVMENLPTITGIESLAVLSRVTNTTADVTTVRRSPTMIAAGWSQQKRRRDGIQLVV